jgi:hypothetical protein
MRSTATPMDHIDMKNKMNATPLAIVPIVPHIVIIFIPPSIDALLFKLVEN